MIGSVHPGSRVRNAGVHRLDTALQVRTQVGKGRAFVCPTDSCLSSLSMPCLLPHPIYLSMGGHTDGLRDPIYQVSIKWEIFYSCV